MVARKKSDKPTRIWSFHAEPATENALLVRELLFRGNRHYNKLVEIERDRVAEYRATREKYTPKLDELRAAAEAADEQCVAIAKAIKDSRAKEFRETGKKARKTPKHLAEQLASTKEHRKQVREQWKEARDTFESALTPAREEYKRRTKERAAGAGPRIVARINAEVLTEMLAEKEWSEAWKALTQVDAKALARVKAARATCDVPPGCYLLIENAAQQAIKTSRPDVPRFRGYRGEGRIGVQLRNETFAGVMTGTSTFLRLRSAPKREGAQGRHATEFFFLSIRVGSEGQQPVWAEFPVRLHRLPPEDALVKWAWVTTRRQGSKFRHELQLTLEASDFGEDKRRPAGEGTVRARFISQTTEQGFLVAEWMSDREKGEVVLPRRIFDRLQYPAVLYGHADKHYDDVRRVLSLWCQLSGNQLTHWRRQWRNKPVKNQSERTRISLARLCEDWCAHEHGGNDAVRELWLAWKAHRLSRNRDLFALLPVTTKWARARGLNNQQALSFWCYLWSRKDKHLRQYAADLRRRAEAQRGAFYRNEAIRLSTQFDSLVTDDTRLSEQKRKPKVEQESDEFRHMREMRQGVAPGRCREIFREVFGPRHQLGPTGLIQREQSDDEEIPGGSRDSRKDAGSDDFVDAAE